MTSERPRRPIIRTPFLIALICAATIGAAVGAYRHLAARPALAGTAHAHLGTVWLEVDEETGSLHGSAQHVYRLTNRTRKPITIIDVRSSCGCTVPTINASAVGPGEEVEVAATIHLDRSGVRNAEVFVHMEGREAQTLTLEAMGRSRLPLRAEPHHLMLSAERAVTMRVIAELWEDDAREPRLKVIAPDGVEAKVANWSLWRPAHPQRRTPVQWAGAVHVSLLDGGTLEDDAALEIVLDDEHALRVPLLMRWINEQ